MGAGADDAAGGSGLGSPDAPDILLTGEQPAERRLTSFTRAAHSVALAGSLRQVMSEIATEALLAADLAAAQILLIDPVTRQTGITGAAGGCRLPEDFVERHDQIRRRGGTMLSVAAFTEQQAVVSPGRRERLLADPVWAPLHDWFASFDWTDFVAVPLIVRGRGVGALNAYCAHRPTAGDLQFLTAMCDQAAVAVDNARLFVESKRRSELEERNRIARGLHDAISQKLFSVTLQAKALTLAAARDTEESRLAIQDSVQAISGLAQSAMRDMRNVINELYPAALAAHGLVSALRDHGALLAERFPTLTVEVVGPAELPIEAAAEENLYWLCVEALHNVAQHAGARSVRVRITTEDSSAPQLRVEIVDDGVGFEGAVATNRRPGHLGLTSMRDRAELLGGSLEIRRGEDGRGTTVALVAPLRRGNDPNRSTTSR